MKYLTIIVLTLFVQSCGPAHQLRKAERLMNKAIAAGAQVKNDTIWKTTDVFHPGEKTTITFRDTVQTTVYQDKIRIQYRTVHDSVRIHVECPNDTIRIQVPVTVHKSIICPDCPRDRFWRGFGMGAATLLCLLILYGLARLIRP